MIGRLSLYINSQGLYNQLCTSTFITLLFSAEFNFLFNSISYDLKRLNLNDDLSYSGTVIFSGHMGKVEQIFLMPLRSALTIDRLETEERFQTVGETSEILAGQVIQAQMNSSSSQDWRISKTKRAKKACDNCRRRKIKCSGTTPCLNCVASELQCFHTHHAQTIDELFFKSPTKLKYELSSLKDSLARMSNNLLSANSQNLKRSLKKAVSALENVDLESFTQIQFKAINDYNETKSLETAMVNNLGLFDFFPAGNNTNANMPISSYFGLYSPLAYYSPNGVSYMMTKLLQIRDNRETRVTMYLILRLLDVATTTFAGAEERDHQASDFSGQLDKILRTLHCDSSNDFIQSQKKSLESSYDMLDVCCELLKQVQITFSKTQRSLNPLDSYIKVIDALSTLCCKAFYLSAFATPFETTRPASLIEVIEKVYWALDLNLAGKMIALLCRRLLDLGHGRWEYNYGIDEKLADHNRSMWWKCLWWDRWYALSTGKPPLLSEEMSDCPFPRAVMLLKVDDEMDCLTLAKEVDMHESNLEGCLAFGYILLTKIISFAFSFVLYNKAFTAYKFYSSATWKDPSHTLTKLKYIYDQLDETFRLFRIKVTSMIKPKLEEESRHRLFIFTEVTNVTICHAMCGLLKRLRSSFSREYALVLDDLIGKITRRSMESSVFALSTIHECENNQVLLQHTRPLVIFVLNIASQIVTQPDVTDLDTNTNLSKISLLCGICKRLQQISSTLGVDFGPYSFLPDNLRIGAISCFIFTRMCCQAYMGLSKTEEQLFMDLEGIDAQIVDTARGIMDLQCSIYKGLFASHRQSYATQCVLKYSTIEEEDLKHHVKSSLENRTIPKTSGSATSNFFAELPDVLKDNVEFDLFLDSLNSLDFPSMFWNEFSK